MQINKVTKEINSSIIISLEFQTKRPLNHCLKVFFSTNWEFNVSDFNLICYNTIRSLIGSCI